MSQPDILNQVDKYNFEVNDFPLLLDRFIFSAIYNLYCGGAEVIRTIDIDNYLQGNELAKKTFDEENGIAFLQDCEAYCEPSNFNYYYNKLKKINLIRDLQKSGYDTNKIYSEDLLDEKHDEINANFEKLTTENIINILKGNVANLENKYVFNNLVEESDAFFGVRDLINELSQEPEVGVKLQGDIFNTIVRGGRKGKLYLRSGSTGMGKTRGMVGDACQIAYPIRYEQKYKKWIYTGSPEKVLYVMTEQDKTEIQTMILSYLTGYNEEIFLYGTFTEEHMDRINIALKIMETYKDNFLFVRIPDPCASVVKNIFRKYSIQKNVNIFFYDYIFSSPAMLEEYRDLKLPEHVCLRLFTTAMKNLAIELNAFILTSTQITEPEDNKKSSWKDFHNIRGSKSIVDLVDFACIMSRPTQEELKIISSSQELFLQPNCVTDIFKNRRGRWNMVRVWSYKDLGTCKTYDLLITDSNNKPVKDFQIIDFIEEERSQEIKDLENLLNTGEISQEIYEKYYVSNENISLAEEKPENLIDMVNDAFGDDKQEKKRLEKYGIGDLI